MPKPSAPESGSVSVRHGRWGEDVAIAQLRVEGFVILERNVRPCPADRRLEIDIIAYDRHRDVLIFVEVKQHKERSPYQRRLCAITKRKKQLLLRACRTWLRRNRWEGSYRFDVIEVYGSPEAKSETEVDHIPHVRLFAKRERFVNWED